MKTIEIYVACHKPSELPQNDIFVPIHVGAKNAKIILPGVQRDDEGDNISVKNPQYCEMTAQYWAWKHSKADYVGLCHYRRYLNFTDKIFSHYTPDNRKQVLVSILNPYTEEKYGLLDKQQIHKIVEDNDVLVANAQDLSKVNTPFGPQKSTLKHWLAHDMALINVKDLYTLFGIVERDYPEIYKSMREYLDKKYFYGFNTFVLRRDLFCEMSAFEFDVLSKLEKQVNISHYNQQLSRIYGFMGEILFSSYIYYLHKNHPEIKIKECQMLYFEQTDPIQPLQPDKTDALTFVIDGTGAPEFMLYPAIHTFLQHIQPEKCYELIILHEKKEKFYQQCFSKIVEQYSNVKIKFLSLDCFVAELKEKFGKFPIYPSCILGWLLPKYHRCIYLRWNVLVQKNVDSLFDEKLNEHALAAVLDVYYQGKLNTFYKEDKEYAENILGINNIFGVVNPWVMYMNLDKIRDLGLENIAEKILQIQRKSQRDLEEVELFNAIYINDIEFLGAEWNVLERSNGDIRFYCNEAPLVLNNAQKNATAYAAVLSYQMDAPWFIDEDEAFYLQYWRIIKDSPLEELFRNHLAVRASSSKMDAKQITWAYINTLLPKGSKRRERIKRLFPKKGFIYRHLKNIINPR